MGKVQTFRFLLVFGRRSSTAEMELSKALARLALAWARHSCKRNSWCFIRSVTRLPIHPSPKPKRDSSSAAIAAAISPAA